VICSARLYPNNLSNQAQQIGRRLITKRQETASDGLDQGHGSERCQTNPINLEKGGREQSKGGNERVWFAS